MRHKNKVKQLSRKAAHRKALMRNLSIALITHKRIRTTLAKAKALRPFIEPLVTRAKEDTMHNRRIVFAKLQNKFAVKELFEVIAPKVGDRPGGYTRVLKLGPRRGDNAEMALIEFVDFNEYLQGEKLANTAQKTKRRRRRRRKKKAASDTATDTQEAVNE